MFYWTIMQIVFLKTMLKKTGSHFSVAFYLVVELLMTVYFSFSLLVCKHPAARLTVELLFDSHSNFLCALDIVGV